MNVLFVSLGCDKNLVDTEMMIGLLVEQGYRLVDEESIADIIVINTCCFINDAKEESIQTILQMAEYRKAGSVKALLVTGCLAQRYRDEIQREIPEVDAIVGTSSIESIIEAVSLVLAGKTSQFIADPSLPVYQNAKQTLTTGGHFAYLKIAEGCDKNCTYCIIPQIRGHYRSVPMEDLFQRASFLVQGGVKELILVAQETTLYGLDLYGKKSLPLLLTKLSEIPGLYWIRILYCYPEEITDELIHVMRDNEKICHYLDIPIQSASDDILKRMGRRTRQKQLRQIIDKLRQEMPDICLRTTLISGFPGESEEDHEETKAFARDMKFDRLGVFVYSPEEGTPAATYKEKVHHSTKARRQRELMQQQQIIAFDKAQQQIGRTLLAMVEGKVVDEDAYIARTYMDAPNVDGYVFIQTTRQLVTGDFAKVRITGSYEYDLIGELEDESSK